MYDCMCLCMFCFSFWNIFQTNDDLVSSRIGFEVILYWYCEWQVGYVIIVTQGDNEIDKVVW